MGLVVVHTLALVIGFLSVGLAFIGLSATGNAIGSIGDGLLDLILG